MLPRSSKSLILRACVRWNSGGPAKTVQKGGQPPTTQLKPDQVHEKNPILKGGKNTRSKGKRRHQSKARSPNAAPKANEEGVKRPVEVEEDKKGDVTEVLHQRTNFSPSRRVTLQRFRPALFTELQQKLDPTSPFFKGNLPLQPINLNTSLRKRMNSVDALRKGPFAASISQAPKPLSAVDIARHALAKNASMGAAQTARCLETVQQLTAVSRRQS